MTQLSDIAIQQFRNQFIIDYRALGKLGNGRTTQIFRGLRGDSFNMPIQGSIVAGARGPLGSDIPLADRDYSQAQITFKNWAIREAIDKFEQDLLEANAVGLLPSRMAEALARREDQVILDALTASSASSVSGESGDNLTVAMLQTIKENFDQNNVPMQDRILVIGPSQEQSLLNDNKVINIQIASSKNLVTGSLEMILGMKVIVLGDMEEGGLAKDGSNIRTCFAFQKNAVGVGFSTDPNVNVWYREESQSNQVSGAMRCGATVALTKGVQKVLCDES